MLIFRATKGQLLWDIKSWPGCQNNNPINLNFHLRKSLGIFEKKSDDKIWSNKDIKVKVPCPVPDRVNWWFTFFTFQVFLVKKHSRLTWKFRIKISRFLFCSIFHFLLDVQANLPKSSPFFGCPNGFGEHHFSNVYNTWDV
jgi:hypothetical protein